MNGSGSPDRYQRYGKPSNATRTDQRSPTRHDRDRVLYSTAFRRLGGVTQVLTPTHEGFLTHNRLTHSLKVAQLSRSISEWLLSDPSRAASIPENLGGLDPDAAEAAALAHDLGHPPFGHVGEQVLDDFARNDLGLPEGFEGNAQSFRIVTRLEPRSTDHVGLDLAVVSRAAILKYPWTRQDRLPNHEAEVEADRRYRLHWKKFGHYAEDTDAFRTARAAVPYAGRFVQSLEAAVMDVADDITYALHDLEDFLSAGLVDVSRAVEALDTFNRGGAGPYAKLGAKLERDYPTLFREASFASAATAVAGHLFTVRQSAARNRDGSVQMRLFVSTLINEYVGGLELECAPTEDMPPVRLSEDHWHQVQILKETTRQFVIQRPDVAALQRGQQTVLSELLKALNDWCEDKDDAGRLPWRLRDGVGSSKRAIIDYVASLSDHHAIALHKSLSGRGHGPLDSGLVL